MRFPTSWDRVSVLQCLTLSCQNVALFHQRKKIPQQHFLATHILKVTDTLSFVVFISPLTPKI